MIKGFKAFAVNVTDSDPLNPTKSQQSFNADIHKAIEWGKKYLEANPTQVVRIDEMVYEHRGHVIMDPITKKPEFFLAEVHNTHPKPKEVKE